MAISINKKTSSISGAVRIPSTAQIRGVEAAWIEACHPHWGVVLMEQAGMAAARVVRDLYFELATDKKVVIVCGRGNNGGDGLVVARHLRRWRVPVRVLLMDSSGKQKSTGDRIETSVNRSIIDELDIDSASVNEEDATSFRDDIAGAGIVVDALLGTGLDRPVEGLYAELIRLVNSTKAPVVAIDVPSGINSDTGQIQGVAVDARHTVTFGFLKAGLLHYPGAQCAGRITQIDIGLPALDDLPPALHKQTQSLLSDPMWWLVTQQQIRSCLPARPDYSHKGTFGRLLSIAGSMGMKGSALLCAGSALRTGVGLSILASSISTVRGMPPSEVIYKELEETAQGSISSKALKTLAEELDTADAVALGPGLTTNADTVSAVRQLCHEISKPCIVDADGLNAISKLIKEAGRKTIFSKPANFILTPHPKELSRLLDMPVAQIQQDRCGAARACVEQFGCNVVLKGAHTVVGTSDLQFFIVPTGNSGMATAGAGDVLSGIIGGLLAQGLQSSDAAFCGAYLHGAAGDVAAARIGKAGLIAGDIMESIPEAMSAIRAGEFAAPEIEG